MICEDYVTVSSVEEALATLGHALALAEPEGYVRVFVDEGRPMAELLRQAVSRGVTPGYAGRLLAAFGSETKDEADADIADADIRDADIRDADVADKDVGDGEIAEASIRLRATEPSASSLVRGRASLRSEAEWAWRNTLSTVQPGEPGGRSTDGASRSIPLLRGCAASRPAGVAQHPAARRSGRSAV